MLRLYLKPEQPPGSTLTRRPAVSAGHLLLHDELLDFFGRAPREDEGESARRRGLLLGTAHGTLLDELRAGLGTGPIWLKPNGSESALSTPDIERGVGA